MQSAIQYLRRELQHLYTPAETGELIKRIFFDLCGYTYTDLILKSHVKLTTQERDTVYSIAERLKKSEPIQYILGHTEFCDLDLVVSRAVLIPRPETEELVKWIISEQDKPPANILDIGTGSGCIALGLKKHFPLSSVAGCDISEEALEVARQNGLRNRMDIRFFKADILSWENFPYWEPVDLMVSNPPYVTTGEMHGLEKNVLDYEPHHALFVPDQDPLLFYHNIIGFSQKWLNPAGRLFLEINENFGEEIVRLMKVSGFQSVELRPDLHNKNRMVRGKKTGIDRLDFASLKNQKGTCL